MKNFMFPVRKKNSLKKNSLLIGRSYIPILDKTSKESYQSYLLSIEEHYDSEEEFYLTKAVERLHPGRLSGLLNALRYILAERPKSFDVEELEESERHMKSLLSYINNSRFEQQTLGEIERFVEYGYRRAVGLGRIYANKESTSASLWVPKIFRGFLFPNSVDIDLEASHYSILAFFAQKHNMKVPIIEGFALKDEKVLKERGSSDWNDKEVKVEFLKLLNYRRSYFQKAEGFRLRYQKEIILLREQLMRQVFENPDLTEEEDPICFKLNKFFSEKYKLLETTDMEAFEVKIMSLYLHSVESEVLCIILKYLKKKNIEDEDYIFDGVLMFDGLYVSRKQFNPDDIHEINDFLLEKTGSKYLRVAIKDFGLLPEKYGKYIQIALLVRN